MPNGVRLLFEEIPFIKSASVGIWVGSGSRHEPANLSGISHAIEHMVFKGTKTRSAARIASDMDAIGGQINAFTTKECTCFYVRALQTHLQQAIDVLTDIFANPRMDRLDWQNERGVIVEEIGMYEDSPEDVVSERLFSSAFRQCPLGRPILGMAGTLKRISAERLARYKDEHYRAGNIVVSMCGQFSALDKESLIARFADLPAAPALHFDPAVVTPSFTTRYKDIEQNHLCLAYPALSYVSPDRYTQQVISNILGGGMSSRLYQKVREERGLCYSIYAFATGHEDVGLLGVYTALGRGTERAALSLITDVIRAFVEDGPTDVELERAREQVKANVLMGLESSSARMNHLGRNELLLGEVKTTEEIIAAYDAVTIDAVRALATKILVPNQLCFSAVGHVASAARYKEILNA